MGEPEGGAPGEGDHPFQVAAGDAVFGGRLGHGGEAFELAHGLLFDFLRHAHRFQLLAELFGVFGGFVGLAELFLDGFQLLAQVEFALGLRELALHLGLNAAAEFKQLELAREVAVDFVEALAAIEHFEQTLALRRGQGGEVAGDEIGQAAGLGDAGGSAGEVVGEVGRAGDDLLEQAEHVLAESLDFGGDGRLDIGDALDAGAEVGVGGGVFQGADTGDAFTEQEQSFPWARAALCGGRRRCRPGTCRWGRGCRCGDRAGR